MQKKNKNKWNPLTDFRRKLPIAKCKKQIIELVAKNPTTILIGETGCGKSTQVPQFLVESKEMQGCSVCITQPRRVSAISLAERVAKENGSKLGLTVGYNVRFDNCSSGETQIKYVTDGMLLREILADPDLSAYNVVILDEIHERTVQTDLLIGLLRDLQERRNNDTSENRIGDLKLILMSATLHCQLFVDFFGNPPIIHVRGRTYPVSIFYTDVPENDYVEGTILAVQQLNKDLDMPGDFLVFLTGQEEIEEVARTLKLTPAEPPMQVLPLYAALPLSEQRRIFEAAPEGTRKIILSTNIAETSVTISGIKYVIDCGLVKVKTYNAATGIEILGVTPVSKAQALQRSGRAGRESAGGCFRLYTEDTFFTLADQPVAEICRADLSSVVIQLFAIGVENPMLFSFLERPPTELLRNALQTVWEIGALGPDGRLSADGELMALFPLAPRMTKVLLLAARSGCGESALTLLAVMSCENLFVSSAKNRKKAKEAHSVFKDASGDHATLLNVYAQFTAIERDGPEATAAARRKFCEARFLSYKSLEYAEKVRAQLAAAAQSAGLDVSESDDETTLDMRRERLRKALAAANPANVARLVANGRYKCIDDGAEIYIHPSSFAHKDHGANLGTIVFSERVQTKRLYARWVSEADEAWASSEL